MLRPVLSDYKIKELPGRGMKRDDWKNKKRNGMTKRDLDGLIVPVPDSTLRSPGLENISRKTGRKRSNFRVFRAVSDFRSEKLNALVGFVF